MLNLTLPESCAKSAKRRQREQAVWLEEHDFEVSRTRAGIIPVAAIPEMKEKIMLTSTSPYEANTIVLSGRSQAGRNSLSPLVRTSVEG